MAVNDQEIWVSAFNVLIAQLDEALIELRRSLASAAVEHGVDSPQVAGVRAQIDETTAKREKAQAERQRVMAQRAGGAAVAVTAEKPKAAPKRKQPGILTQSDLKLIEASAEIMSTPPDGEEMAFTHSVLCQVGLPRSKFDGREFMRQSGAAWINVQAGWLDEGKGPVQQPVPYGPLPRLALAWVSTFAVRHGTREIPIGDSAADFLRLMLGADTASQGARYTTLRKQMHALAACRLQLGFRGRTFNGQPVEQFDSLGVQPRQPAKAALAGRDDALRALLQRAA